MKRMGMIHTPSFTSPGPCGGPIPLLDLILKFPHSIIPLPLHIDEGRTDGVVVKKGPKKLLPHFLGGGFTIQWNHNKVSVVVQCWHGMAPHRVLVGLLAFLHITGHRFLYI